MDPYGDTHYGMLPACGAEPVNGRTVVSSIRPEEVTCLACKATGPWAQLDPAAVVLDAL